MSDLIRHRLTGSRDVMAALAERSDDVAAITERVRSCLARGGTVYTCGNGGSAAEALHLTEELVGCYRDRTRPPQRAVCLNADPTALTCIANDFGFEAVFARPCQTLLNTGDVLVVLSTSGNSPNLVRALEVARARDAGTIGLLGGTGGACLAHCDHAVLVPSDDSAHIQEAHLAVVHAICETLEPASPVDA